MAPRVDDTPCHLLSMPYEILKPILFKLSQRDQISAAKTCVQLWELAYPLAYNRLIVEIGPKTKESTWKALASGVGLGYVQHLEVRSRFERTDQPTRDFELVVSTMIAYLGRDSLRSLSLVASDGGEETINAKDVAIILETQHLLRSLNLPRMRESSSPSPRCSQRSNRIVPCLQKLTILSAFDSVPQFIASQLAKGLLRSQELHLEFAALRDHEPRSLFTSMAFTSPLRSELFSRMTKVTLDGYDFAATTHVSPTICFPALRALALVNCPHDTMFFLRMQGASFPSLIALKIQSESFGYTALIDQFICDLSSLRELILHGTYVWIADGSALLAKATCLELLSMRNSNRSSVFPNNLAEKKEVFTALSALRFLSLCVDGRSYGSWDGMALDIRRDSTESLKALGTSGYLQILQIQSNIYRIDHDNMFGGQVVIPADTMANVEILVGRIIVEELGANRSLFDGGRALPFISIDVGLSLLLKGASFGSGFGNTPWQSSTIPKRIFSPSAGSGFRDAHEVMAEIMDKYANDGYYFLEDFVASMMDVSRGRFKSA